MAPADVNRLSLGCFRSLATVSALCRDFGRSLSAIEQVKAGGSVREWQSLQERIKSERERFLRSVAKAIDPNTKY
jgi:hypothetical protein